MKTEDLKNYIFEQCLSEAKTHPLVMRGAQWVVDQIGGYDGPDAKNLHVECLQELREQQTNQLLSTYTMLLSFIMEKS